MRDFTFTMYYLLLKELLQVNYKTLTIEQLLYNTNKKVVILRHDVDSWPSNALQMAKLEAESGVKSTYYFRVSPLSYNEMIIREVAALGHEIGYHYEDLTSCHGDKNKAIKSFERNLEHFRKFYPVKTIAMHGKPLSRWNNLDLWQQYDFHDYGLIGEPYLSLDFDKILYLTDTGNCWDGDRYSIRDSVKSKFSYNIHTTFDLIAHLEKGLLPQQIMLNVHPARWNDNLLQWVVRYYILTLPKYQTKKWVKTWRNRKK
jgi:hypothetical protein